MLIFSGYPVIPLYWNTLGIFCCRKTVEHSGNSPRSANNDSSSSRIVNVTSSNPPHIGLTRTPVDTTSSNHPNTAWWSPVRSKSGWVAKTGRSSGWGVATGDSTAAVTVAVTTVVEEWWDFGRGREWLCSWA